MQNVAVNGNLKNKAHEGENQTQFGKTDGEIGKELAEKKPHGADRRDEKLFERAAFLLADDGESGEECGDVQQENSGQAGQEEIRGTGVRVEEQLGPDIDGKGGTILKNAAKRFVEADGGGHVDGLAGDRGVRAVDENEDLSAHVVEEAVRIIHGNLDADAGLPGNDGVVEIAIVLHVTDEMKGVGVFQAVDQLAALAAAVGIQHDGIDLADVGVNAETKHNHLQPRNDKRKKNNPRAPASLPNPLVKY